MLKKLSKYSFGLFFIVAIFYSATSLAQEQNLAESDYQAYSSTNYASGKWNAMVKSGMEAFHSGNFDVAESSLYMAFNKGCESPIVTFMLALISEYKKSFYSSLEYYKMAEKGFKSANKDHRYNLTFDENYGRALYYSGKTDEALPILRKAAKKSNSYWLLKLLGMLSYQQGDTLNAVSYFERAVRIKSSDVTNDELVVVYGMLGKLFLYKGEQDGALRYYQKVLELDPNNPEAKKFVGSIEKNYQQQKVFKLMEDM